MSQELMPAESHGNSASAMDIATSRSAQEVQAAMVIAKKFPRDETTAFARIMRSCQRQGLAECAMYAYNRGGQMVTGPSIRMAEALAQGWGNIDYGVIELEQKDGESVCMAYAWDLEMNTRSTKIFSVKHERSKKTGNVKLTDPRDIYELVANNGARRMRACVLAVIPGDIQDAAVAQCEKTLQGKSDKPLADRVRDMVTAFSGIGVTKEMIEAKLSHKIEATAEAELVTLRKIFTSIRDGVSSAASWFTVGAAAEAEANTGTKAKASSLNEKLAPKPNGNDSALSIASLKEELAAAKSKKKVAELCKEYVAALTEEDEPVVMELCTAREEELNATA